MILWSESIHLQQFLQSSSGPDVIISIPYVCEAARAHTRRFTGSVKLKSVCLRATGGDSAPRKMKLFTNRDDIDFDNAEELPAAQEFELAETDQLIEYPTRLLHCLSASKSW